jgi:LacI family transcriptional regulator
MATAKTVSEVAEMAGVSRLTVSKVINNKPGVAEDTRQRILEIAQNLGYLSTRAIQRRTNKQSSVIGVVVPTIGTQHISEIVRGIGSVAYHSGHDVLIHTTAHEEAPDDQPQVSFLARGMVDALVIVLPKSIRSYLEVITSTNLPAAVIDPDEIVAGLPILMSDNYAGARAAMQHLMDLNHTRIAHISGWQHHDAGRERQRAYTEHLLAAQLPLDPNLIREGNYTHVDGYNAALELLSQPNPPTAIFAANDYSAFGAIEAARSLGLQVPRDVSVVGFDDIPMAIQMHPNLTTVRQQQYEMGKTVAKMVLGPLKGVEAIGGVMRYETQLVVRASTAQRRP